MGGMTFSDDNYFVTNSSRKNIRGRYTRLFPPEECARCLIPAEWEGEKLVIQLDHVNGDHYDNRLENLRWLCPNCHSQTPTFAGRGRKGGGFAGHSHSPETRKKIGDGNRGYRHTEEAKKKMSLDHRKKKTVWEII